MVTNSASNIADNSGPDESYCTGFTICAPNESGKCRLVRGRRHRPRNPGGMRRVVFNKHAAILGNVLAEIRPSSGSSVFTWTGGGALLKIVMAIASVVVAFAYDTSFDVATGSTVYMAAFSWVIVAVSLRLAAATTAATTVTATAAATAAATHDVGTGASARVRYRAGRLLSGRRLASCHRTRRRHGRRRENRGYLQKVSRNSGASRSNGHGFGALRGGAGPENGANGQVCVCVRGCVVLCLLCRVFLAER